MRAKLAQHKTLHGEDQEERQTGERVFRYDSLNEASSAHRPAPPLRAPIPLPHAVLIRLHLRAISQHLVMLSLTRAIKYKQHKRTLKARPTPFGTAGRTLLPPSPLPLTSAPAPPLALPPWPLHAQIATGWLLNHAFFTMLLLVFMTYGCRFEEESDLSEKESQAAHPRPAPPTHLRCISHAPRSITRAFPVHLPVPPDHIPAASPLHLPASRRSCSCTRGPGPSCSASPSTSRRVPNPTLPYPAATLLTRHPTPSPRPPPRAPSLAGDHHGGGAAADALRHRVLRQYVRRSDRP